MEGDISTDPFYRLIFPTMDMLEPSARATLEEACATKEPLAIKAAVEEIREELNPHPAGQKALNAPKKAELTGVQHKYSETVLFFASAAQTCHAYCTYCFRWAQFIGDSDLRFAQKDAGSLFDYLAEHEEVSDILFTGGDPMIMKTRAPPASPRGRHTGGRAPSRPLVWEQARLQAVLRALQGPDLPAARQEPSHRHARAHVLAATLHDRRRRRRAPHAAARGQGGGRAAHRGDVAPGPRA